jgi:uridine phosphorylase
VAADAQLTKGLVQAAPGARAGAVASVDLFYDREAPAFPREALAVEMEAATLFAIGAWAPVAVGCVLVVSDTFTADGERRRIEDRALHDAAERMGEVAARALSP